MKIGIGIPSAIPGKDAFLIPKWARQAEAASFSSIGVTDRIVYSSCESMTVLAAMAGATTRIGILSNVIVAPLRSTSMLAKQAASLDVISGGRLTLGLSVGQREDDFVATSASYHDRGKRFDEQLALMKRLWEGQPFSQEIGVIGPLPVQSGGPEIVIGAISPMGIKRVGRWASGYIGGVVGPDHTNQCYQMAKQSWQEAGRSGKPRLLACAYFGLGPEARERAQATVKKYYAYRGPLSDVIAGMVAATKEELHTVIQRYAEIETDELILVACIPEVDQVARLADALGSELTA
jgi:alkanesulfonate monooxygenase SsuD/methylene tetrahydromethanopterin reductase-like flavin-dependent oxidoreductase (luciferase family)